MKKHTLDEFISMARKVHGDKYDYSKVVYVNNKTKVCIICPIRGEFWQRPDRHLRGQGCPSCDGKMKRTLETFIKQAKRVHGDKYDYSKSVYTGTNNKICIICPEHGEFWQRPNDHLRGKGCPKCKSSHLETEVRNILTSESINFEEQKTWDWLVYKNNQYVDFYLSDYNIVIECQGIQHFESHKFFGGEKGFNNIKDRDKHKLRLCVENNITVIYFSNLGEDYPYPYEVITDIKDLIYKIKQVGLTNQL